MKTILFAFILLIFAPGFREKPKCVEYIKPDCYCIQIYDPVCGCNKVTYGNACMAQCASMTKYKKGECKENSKS